MATAAPARLDSAFADWTHAEWRPLPGSPLARAIERVWYFAGTLGASRERVFPDGTLELIVQLDTPHRPAVEAPCAGFPPLCATGLRTTAEVVEAPLNRCRVLGLRLTPPAAFALLDSALPELTSLTVDLHELLGRATAELGNRIHDAPDGAAAVRTAAAWAARRIARGRRTDPTVQRALNAIAADGGTRSLAELNAWEGRSRARFAAAFRDSVGVSPKRFARILRFDRALHAIALGDAPLGAVALAAGYYDQAHFTNEFHEHAGLTPLAYVRATRFPATTALLEGAEHFSKTPLAESDKLAV